MNTQTININLDKPNKGTKLVETKNYFIIVREDLVWKSGKITKVPLLLQKKNGNGNSYKLFRANPCLKKEYCDDCEGNDTLQIHVSKVRLLGDYDYDYIPKVPISLVPNKREVFVEVLEYNYKNPKDRVVLECGKRTNIPVPFLHDEDDFIGFDPQPERKGKSILVGKS